MKKKDINTTNLAITKRYANIKELSVYIGLSVKTLYEFVNLQKIPSIKYGKKLLFDLQDIDKLMESLKRPHIASEETSNNIIVDCHDSKYNVSDSSHADTIKHGKGERDV
jgi:excisionase family DNA binding protein